jgi:hypothetical protein
MKGTFYLNRMKQFMFTEKSAPESAFMTWQFDDEVTTTGALWRIAIEAVALGSNALDVTRVLRKWNLNEDTAIGFAKRCGITLELTKRAVGSRSLPEWMASFERFPRGVPPQIKFGIGASPLEAMADLTEAGAYLQNQTQLEAVAK